jgi:glycosyltransferase involved in cell wall biosynthesis
MKENWISKVKDMKHVCAINTFNNELTIYACLEQAVKNFEHQNVFIFDDGSTDRTIEYIDLFNQEHNTEIQILDVGEWDPWPDQKIERDHGPDKGKVIETGKTHAKSKLKSWHTIKLNFPDAIYYSLEADVILLSDALERAKKRIEKWDNPQVDCEFFNVVFTINSEYVRPVCASEESLNDRLPGIKQRKVYDQPGDWTFACFWTGGELEIGPDPVWPYGACLFPWTRKNQCEKKGQDVDNPYGFHMYCYNNKTTKDDFEGKLILKISEIDDKDVDWSILKSVWFPKIIKLNSDTLKRYIKEEKQ